MKDIPKHVRVGKSDYCIVFTKHISKGLAGLCEDKRKYILLSASESPDEILRTLFHELLHAIEKEYDLKLGHKKINKLEAALAQIHLQLK